MAYTSPIALLSGQQRAQMPDTDLKKVRNELLLHFQFSAEPVVEINGQEYDKDEVVQLMESLQANPQLHWTIYQNEAVRLILETGNLSLFNRFKALQQIDEHPAVAEEIHALLAQMINEELPEKILEFTAETTSLLTVIKYYTDRISEENRSLAYSETLHTMDVFLKSIKERFPLPYIAPGNYTFHPEMQHILKREVLNMFKQLPTEFQPCLHRLGTYCNNQVVMTFVEKEAEVKSWPRDSLAMVIEAAVIASEIFNRNGNLQIANNLHDYLTKKKEASPWRVILFSIFVIIFMFRIARACNRSDRSSNRYDRNDSFSIRDPELRRALEAQGYNVGQPSATSGQSAPYNHEMRMLNGSMMNANHLFRLTGEKWNAKTKTLTVHYKTEVIPAATGFLYKFIPGEVGTKYPSKRMDVNLEFSKEGLNGATFAHRLERQEDGKFKLIKGVFTADTSSSVIRVKPLQDVKRYKGFVTLMDMEGNVLDRDTLGLKVRTGTTYIDLVYNGQTEAEMPDDRYTNMDAFSIRSRCFLNNLRRLENLELTEKSRIPVSNLWVYQFENAASADTARLSHTTSMTIKTLEQYVSYAFTSYADDVAYFDLSGPDYNIRYMIQTKTGEVVGCQMIQMSRNYKRVERMDLFVSK